MPGQRQRRGIVSSQGQLATGNASGKCLGRVGEHLSAGAVAERLSIQLVCQRRQIDAQLGIHGLQGRQTRGQVPGQPELVRNPQPRFQHRDATGRAVPQRTLIRCHHDNPRAPAHPDRDGPDQRRVAGVVAGNDQHVKRPDPGRRRTGEHDRLGGPGT